MIFLYFDSFSEKEGIFNIIYAPFHKGNHKISVKTDLMLHKSVGNVRKKKYGQRNETVSISVFSIF